MTTVLEKFVSADSSSYAEIIETFDNIGIESAITELGKLLLEDTDAEIRCRTAEILGEIGKQEAIPALCKALLEDPIPEVRGSSARALGKIGKANTPQS